jgi:hypothetical protein
MDNAGKKATPESELLIACARVPKDQQATHRIKAVVTEGVDWDLLLDLAWQHGMVPFLYLNLKSASPNGVPEEKMSQLRKLFLENHQRNIFLAGELVKLFNIFTASGISVIAYKGPTIAALIYGNLALRRFSDLDIIVRKNDFERAKNLLVSDGYVPQLNIAAARQRDFLRVNYVQQFNRADGRAIVELHWDVAPRNFAFHFDMNRLWDRAIEIELLGQKVLMPCPEDLLLLLCVHGTKDLWERFEWIVGVAELIRVTPSLDWQRILQEARRTSSTRMLFLGLALSQDMLATDLPKEIIEDIRADDSVQRLLQIVKERLFSEDKLYGLGFRVPFHLKARERLSDRVRYCARLALNTTHGDWDVLSLPPSLSFVYYFLRPFRLIKSYGRLSQS